MRRWALAAVCALLVAGCRKAEAPPADGAADEEWLAGTWRRATDDARFAGWILFRPPRQAAAMGARLVRGTYVARGNVVSLMAPLRTGVVAESHLTVSPDHRRLTLDDGGTAIVFEHTGPTSALDAAIAADAPENAARLLDAGAAPEKMDWLAGTWQRGREERWLLFNPPSQVIELSGHPAAASRRGKLVVHGHFVDALFPAGELHLEANTDEDELKSDETPPATWRRGAPPR